jgi:acetylornithine deacetylase/succinyl-diaminopimelate desuccinylase-like protein
MDPAVGVQYAHENKQRFLDELITLCAIPSISTDPAYITQIQQVAEWIAAKLHRLDAEKVQIFPTEGHPVVYGELLKAEPNAKTILIYGHYDVQPAESQTLKSWLSDPFTPTVRGENLYGRGVTDMKGQIMACINAVEAVTHQGDFPVNIKFMIEGEEEIGSAHLEEFIIQHKKLLACDYVLNADTGMVDPNMPTITYALRGLYACELRVYGPQKDLHSGSFGGTIHNPAQALCELIAGMHDDQGRITIPGFYDKVQPLTKEERIQLACLPKDENFYLSETGAPALWGETGFTPEERVTARPTLEINGLYSGFTGEGSKTVLPAYAMAKISCRLVPDQDPEEVHNLIENYLQNHAPATIRWELINARGNPATVSNCNSPAIKAIRLAFETVWHIQPIFKREGGSVAAVLHMQKHLKADTINTGFCLPDDSMHGSNEKLHLPTWYKGTEALIHFFYNLANI